ncbi:hypothetical protein [Pantoea ananatis]
MNTMPFNFDHLSNGKVFISNLAGFHSFVDDDELHFFVDNNFPSGQLTSQLLKSRLFIADDVIQAVSKASLSSAFAKRLMNNPVI